MPIHFKLTALYLQAEADGSFGHTACLEETGMLFDKSIFRKRLKRFLPGSSIAGILLLSVVLSIPAFADEETVGRLYPVNETSKLRLEVPASWLHVIEKNGKPMTITFRIKNDKSFAVMVTPLLPREGTALYYTDTSIKGIVTNNSREIARQTAAKTLAIKEFKGTSGSGYHYFAVDPSPEPDGWKYLTQGMIRVADLGVTFSIFTNDPEDKVVKESLKMLAGAKLVHSAGPIGEMLEEDGYYLLSAKGSKRWLRFPKSDYRLHIKERKPDGKSFYYMFVNTVNNLNVSFFIEPVSKCSTSNDCREMVWNTPNPSIVDPVNVKRYERNDFSVIEYFLPVVYRKKLDQMNVSAELVRDGYRVDLHVSKVLYKDPEKELFDGFIDSLSIKPR